MTGAPLWLDLCGRIRNQSGGNPTRPADFLPESTGSVARAISERWNPHYLPLIFQRVGRLSFGWLIVRGVMDPSSGLSCRRHRALAFSWPTRGAHHHLARQHFGGIGPGMRARGLFCWRSAQRPPFLGMRVFAGTESAVVWQRLLCLGSSIGGRSNVHMVQHHNSPVKPRPIPRKGRTGSLARPCLRRTPDAGSIPFRLWSLRGRFRGFCAGIFLGGQVMRRPGVYSSNMGRHG